MFFRNFDIDMSLVEAISANVLLSGTISMTPSVVDMGVAVYDTTGMSFSPACCK